MNMRKQLTLLGTLVLAVSTQQAWSLQGGPVMPEYVQFEPVDATDVVNLNTGNFSYTLPLSEVPGPYGGFPLSMSYHAGIGPNQEATMVGLGWSLNPGGAINRTLRGTPDDQFHGGDLVFIYAYSSTTVNSVNVTMSYGPVGLNMSYNSMSGYGLNATVTANFDGFYLGASFGTGGVGLNGGAGYSSGGGTLGVGGSIGYGPEGFNVGANVGYTTASGVTIGASMGVSVDNGGKASSSGGFGLSMKQGGDDKGAGASVGIDFSEGGVSVSAGYNGLGGNVNLSSRGFSAGVSVAGTGLAVSGANDQSSNSKSSTASLVVPGLFSYSRTIYESWVRQATTEHSYGYMYQAGPSIPVDGVGEDYGPLTASGTGTGTAAGIPWNWNFKGRSLDHVGDPTRGHLLPGNDMFEVSGQGVNGAFRATSLSQHQIYMSIEALGGAGGEEESQGPNALFYLLKDVPRPGDPPNTDATAWRSRQAGSDFDLISDATTPPPSSFTEFAYEYCHEKTELSDPYNVHFYGGTNTDPASLTERFNKVKANECSRYAVLKSNHLNEGSRNLFSLNEATNLDLNKKFRNRMAFTFMGENGGYFESEPLTSGTKRGRKHLYSALMKKEIKNWRNSPYPAAQAWDEPILGVRQIQPILEDGSNIGRLQGFKITNPDGTQYLFTQPVRSLLTASYTTNQPLGGPAFIDRRDSRSGEDFRDILADGWSHFISNPVGSIADVGRWAGKLVVGSISSFLFYSPNFTDKCDDIANGSTSTYNYSYSMSTNPYSTQWLLTEIRGPDFVHFGQTQDDMSRNFGYQVKFKYSKPGHYAWRTPYAPPGLGNQAVPNLRLQKNGVTPENCLSELYHASFGIKEMVYLESIETMTHKAEFKLNNPVTEPRIDGKGWVFKWKGLYHTVAGKQVVDEEGIPIMVGTHFPLEKHVKLSTLEPKGAGVYVDDPSNPDALRRRVKMGDLGWSHYDVDFTIREVFLDIQPTAEQIAMMVDKKIIITGFNHTSTKPDIQLADVLNTYPPDEIAPSRHFYCESDPEPEALPCDGTVQSPSYTVSAPNRVTDSDNFGTSGTTFTAEVESIVRSQENEMEFGAYKVVFKNAAVLSGHFNTGYSYSEVTGESGSSPAEQFKNFDPASAGVPAVDDSVPLKLTSGGGDFHGKFGQPLLVYNDFVDFNHEVDAHQMRFLKFVDIKDKADLTSPLKRFTFDYKNDIQPNTLNSYEFLETPATALIDRHMEAYPLPPDPKVRDESTPPPAPRENALQGKLKLESVTEMACAGVNCAENMSLPPFRFFYQNEEKSTFVARPWRDESIRLSTEQQDQWGFYNPFAGEINNKTRQGFADMGGAVWSLNKIIDPSGGVMEVQYERDTYYGENYAEDDLALPMQWSKCVSDPTKVCLDFMPKKWIVHCDRSDNLVGEWTYTTDAPGQSLDYVKQKGFLPGAELFFNLQQSLVTEVGCGINWGFWKSGGCDRHRSISLVGSARIQDVSEVTVVGKPFFDNAAYQKDKDDELPTNGACDATVRTDCCIQVPTYDYVNHVFVNKDLNKYWHCNYPVYRVKTDVPVSSLNTQYIKSAEKLRDHDWAITGSGVDYTTDPAFERYGVAWARQSATAIKGGDIRVKELIKRDIGLVQRTRYDYAVGQLTQYPDSAFSVAFATQFSTGKITDILGADLGPTFDKRYHNLPSMSRIQGIGDEDLFLLPGASVTYPKVTLTNLVVQAGKALPFNGKTEFEFQPAEQIGFLKLNVSTFTVPAGVAAENLYVEYLKENEEAWLPLEKIDPKALTPALQDQPRTYSYEIVRMDIPGVFQAKEVRKVRFYWKDTRSGNPASIITLQYDGTKPVSRVVFHGSLNGSALEIVKDRQSFEKFDFDDPILVREVDPANANLINYRDYTSRLGKPKSTAFYRWKQNSPPTPNVPVEEDGRYILAKKDSMAYAHAAPSVDKRFIPDADASKVGQYKERWSYERKRKCDVQGIYPDIVDCKDNKEDSQWKVYKDVEGTKTVTYTRYPTFLTQSKSITGFNGSRQPGDTDLGPGETDFIVTSVANHFFDPITGQPTLSVAYAGAKTQSPGNELDSPSKITRITPAYIVDPGQDTTDLPNLMFEKNMLEHKFREDVFTFQSGTTVKNFDDQSLFSGANSENGGVLAPRMTAMKISPYEHKLLTFSSTLLRPVLSPDYNGTGSVTQPIVAAGSYTPRFDLVGNNQVTTNRAIFDQLVDLNLWNGSRITKVNGFLKAVEAEDANYVSTANHFDPRGLHQIALFGNARFSETAILTPEGWANALRHGEWDFGTTVASLERGYIKIPAPFDFQHSIDPQIGRKYVVEFQVYSSTPTELTLEFRDDASRQGGHETISIPAGVSTHQFFLDGDAGWGGNHPNPGTVALHIKSTATTGAVGFKYLRAYDKEAQALAYVYDKRGDMIQSIDVSNVSTYYEYDLFGKLTAIRNDDGVMLTAGSREQMNK